MQAHAPRLKKAPQVMSAKVCGASPGEASVKEANAARFRQTAEREFQAFRKERLATGELECQKLISAAQTHLTQARGSLACM